MIVSAFSGFEPEYLEDGQNTDGTGHGTVIADKKYRVFSITIMTAKLSRLCAKLWRKHKAAVCPGV